MKSIKFLNLLFFIFSWVAVSTTAQSVKSEKLSLQWNQNRVIHENGLEQIEMPNFLGAMYLDKDSWIPYVGGKIAVENNGAEVVGVLQDAVWEPVEEIGDMTLGNDFVFEVDAEIKTQRHQQVLVYNFPAFRRNNGSIERFVSGTVSFSIKGQKSSKGASRNWKTNSVLRSGKWTKVGVVEDGVYRITYGDLVNQGVISGSVSSSNIRLFGNGGGALPIANDEFRRDDLYENAIVVNDGGDGQFNSGDFILFYGQGQVTWDYNANVGTYTHQKNYMSDTTYYFVTADYPVGSPKRVLAQNLSSNSPQETISTFYDFKVFEENNFNLLKSGRLWFSNEYSVIKEYDYNFSFPNRIASDSVFIRMSSASRYLVSSTSTFTAGVNGDIVAESVQSGGPMSSGQYADYAKAIVVRQGKVIGAGSNFTVKVNYLNAPSNDKGWLDYLEVAASRNLRFDGSQLLFWGGYIDQNTVRKYTVQSGANSTVWNITDPLNPKKVNYSAVSSNAEFVIESNENEKFVAFSNYKTPAVFRKQGNQDLHGLGQYDMIIISHPNFISTARKWADFRSQNDDLEVLVVTPQSIFNEFSSGSQDITGFKDFLKMFYDRAEQDNVAGPQNVLLIGDGSYSYNRNISENSNYILTYQSSSSLKPLRSYTSDDYFVLLDDDESEDFSDLIDMGIGRIMIQSTAEAEAVLAKVKAYESTNTFGDWRTLLTYVADDQDGNSHMRDAEQLASYIDDNHPTYNANKIYLDAYQQISTPAGDRYPDVNIAINDAMEQGTLLMTYVGHGGVKGWADERVLGIDDINSWTNSDKLPVFLTATCEFSRFDDPDIISGGEYVLLNPNGGGSALLTTTRLVYADPNFDLAYAFMVNGFDFPVGQEPCLGDLLIDCKEVGLNRTDPNFRNFTLLGDPTMVMAYPHYAMELTARPDTLRRLGKVTMSGRVVGLDGEVLTSFNGELTPSVYAQRRQVSTLGNDDTSPYKYTVQNQVIFKGRVTVKNGLFEFSFVVPKDVNIDYGKGKVSLYADNGQIDGAGYDTAVVVGGISDSMIVDDEGPEIELWMNNEQFVFGGITDMNPVILSKVFDESGINTVGNGIGHDIVAILDENSSNPIVLNDFYTADLDSYQSGEIRYNLRNIEAGKHTLTIRVWDVNNNSSSATTEFVVQEDGGLSLKNVLNYPNPFTTNTDFYFEHNAPGQMLDVKLQVFTMSGKLVKTIRTTEYSDGFRSSGINWDGTDDFGDRIGRGTYVYKLSVTTPSGESKEVFEKLVIL